MFQVLFPSLSALHDLPVVVEKFPTLSKFS
jgi:hypothetical protein